ncbi:MAG: hypothetical protein JOZ11_16955 [Alphaproteobacteria bacterium]|nr:hypothetical protein [Alphaproteobacteria bacterium]
MRALEAADASPAWYAPRSGGGEANGRRRAGLVRDSPPSLMARWGVIGEVFRSALARAGVDAAQATRLCLANEAAAAPAALSDAPEVERSDGDSTAAAEARHPARADFLQSHNPGAGAELCRRGAAVPERGRCCPCLPVSAGAK